MFFTSDKIQVYIEICEQKQVDLENAEIWSRVYLPATRTTETEGNDQGKVTVKHVQIRLVVSNEQLMGFGPPLNWLRKKDCIYTIYTFDNM